jgi:hypothetical protein
MRQAAVSALLLRQARAAADAEAGERRELHAEVEAPAEAAPQSHRLATTAGKLARRARALAARTT